MISILMLLAGLSMVILGANGLVNGASSIARRLHVSDLVIGLTVVAFGTSAPELTISIYSALKGETEIAIGNVVGSNIFNVLFILGVSALIFPLKVQNNTVLKEIPLSILAALVLLVCANDRLLDGSPTSMISHTDGIMLLGFFAIFLYYTFDMARNNPAESLQSEVPPMPWLKSIIYVAGGLLLLVFGGKWMVDGAVVIAEGLGMSKSIIGLTIVAAGTSLPELATSIVAAIKKNADIAVGNVVGSNIFNIFLILGVSGAVVPLELGNITNWDLLLCLFVSIFMLILAFDRVINRLEGGVLLTVYAGYIAYLLLSNG